MMLCCLIGYASPTHSTRLQYFEMLGWKGEDAITDSRLDALLKRVVAFKQAYEKWRDQQVRLSVFVALSC